MTFRTLKRRLRKLVPRSAQATFTEIYAKKHWGHAADPADYYSGFGSHDPTIADPYVASVADFLSTLRKKPDAVDLGCGDFAIGSRIRPYCGRYVACDVVKGLIDRNRERYGHDDVEFVVADITKYDPPAADIAFVRQVLQHLSNRDIGRVVARLSAKFAMICVTEHLPAEPGFLPNVDKATGPDHRIHAVNSGVVLTEPPFNLRPKQSLVLCESFFAELQRETVIRTTLYRL